MKPIAPLLSLFILFAATVSADDRPWPALPEENAFADLPAQSSPYVEGPRAVRAHIYYPGKSAANVNKNTGLFLSLHNWGGTNAIGTADPQFLADRYNVISICVDYFQSGSEWAKLGPYDFGYLQGLDALRALYWVHHQLKAGGTPFNDGRIYSTGGSGGGNVTQMVNKLAPRTFAAIIDMCGMAKLTDDIAYGVDGGSILDAKYAKDPASPDYLSPDAQALRDLSNPVHLNQMKEYGQETMIFVVHGTTDEFCLTRNKRDVVNNMHAAGLSVTALFLEKQHVDGKVFTTTGHSMGDRTLMVPYVADPQLLPDSPDAALREGATDFERQDVICYTTPNGCWEISYAAGYPVGRLATK
jgi:hypothetical protein